MYSHVRLYSNKKGEICRFLKGFYKTKEDTYTKNDVFSNMYLDCLEYEHTYQNPIEIANIIGVYIDNVDKFSLKLWVSFDKNFFIKITDDNANNIIKYLYERYPY